MPPRIKPPPPGGVFPLCFKSRAEYDGWWENAFREHHKNPKPFTYCEDCTQAYQWQMLLAGRCGNPAANP